MNRSPDSDAIICNTLRTLQIRYRSKRFQISLQSSIVNSKYTPRRIAIMRTVAISTCSVLSMLVESCGYGIPDFEDGNAVALHQVICHAISEVRRAF